MDADTCLSDPKATTKVRTARRFPANITPKALVLVETGADSHTKDQVRDSAAKAAQARKRTTREIDARSLTHERSVSRFPASTTFRSSVEWSSGTAAPSSSLFGQRWGCRVSGGSMLSLSSERGSKRIQSQSRPRRWERRRRCSLDVEAPQVGFEIFPCCFWIDSVTRHIFLVSSFITSWSLPSRIGFSTVLPVAN